MAKSLYDNHISFLFFFDKMNSCYTKMDENELEKEFFSTRQRLVCHMWRSVDFTYPYSLREHQKGCLEKLISNAIYASLERHDYLIFGLSFGKFSMVP